MFCCRAAALIIQDKKLLVVEDSINLPGFYYAIGGAINAHETSEEAVTREVYKETGARLDVERLGFVNEEFFIIGGKKFHQISFYYLMKIEQPLDIFAGRPTDQKGESLHWLPLNDLRNYNLVPRFLQSRRLEDLTVAEHIITKEY